MSDLLQSVVEVTGDVRPTIDAPAGALTQARIAVATAVVTGQQSDFFQDQSGLTPPVPDPTTLNEIQAAIQQVPPNPPLRRVVRRGFVTRISPIPKLGVAPGAGRGLTATHGPFLDALDRPVWIDEFAASRLIAIQRLGDTAPFLYFPDSGFTGTTDTLPLAPGTVWIPASQFVTTAPEDGFVGLRILGGSVKFSRPFVIDGSSPILLPRFSRILLDVNLDIPVQPAGSGPGADARAAVVSPPTTAVFLFEPSGAILNAAAAASLTAFGTQCRLTFSAAPAAFDFVLGRLGFPFTQDATTFPIGESQSTLFRLSGAGAVTGAQWSIPVTTGSPETLGAAAGAGGIALTLASGINMLWDGRTSPADCGDCELVADPGTLTLAGLAARTTALPHSVELWTNAPSSAATLRFPTAFPFRFVSDAAGVETFGLKTAISSVLDQPRTINNVRSRLEGTGFLALQQTIGGTLMSCEASAPLVTTAPAQSYAIRNALLKASTPSVLGVAGSYKDSAVASGVLGLEFTLSLLIPTLPDPYATNLAFNPAAVPADSRGTMSMVLRWNGGQPPAIEVQLPFRATERTIRLAPTPTTPPTDPTDAANLAALQKGFAQVSPISPNAISLLDLSTNVSQFGVSFDPTVPPPTAVVLAPPVFVQDLFLQAKAFGVHVLTLPAVEWEPVFTPDQSKPFPSPLTFADAGGTTELAIGMVTLLPIAPLPAIQGLVDGYNNVLPAPPVVLRFTLPFGMVAVTAMERSFIGAPRPTVSEITPDFSSEGLIGGEQLSIKAPAVPGGGESPELLGGAVQLHNARFAGQPSSVTVLTALNPPIHFENTFNDNFGPLGKTPRVPITRIDISGFGESLFSDWKNPADGASIISKVRLDVITGRTAREIVQISTVLYPYAVRVVRTITLERQNAASVIRRDSGWQATSDGAYAYPNPAQPPALITHPGVVSGVVGVTNIRDTGQTFKTSDGSELMAVRFDCAVLMENVVAGGGPLGVPARDQLGYVQITDPPKRGALAPDQYAELLNATGLLGGRIDCIIDIGGSGLHMRVQQVGVAPSANVGRPEFVVAAWGSPILPGGGQWSFVRKFRAAESPQPLDPDRGVPLVRQGPAGSPHAGSPYRFLEPSDLFNADAPPAEYGILHSTGTQRLLFPLPKIEASTPFVITSTRAPLLADPYALATALGVFPRADICIPFPDANYQLVIGAGGHLRLQRPTPSFPAPTLRRTLRDSNTVRSIAYISDPQPPDLGSDPQPPSLVTVSIDTAAAIPWSVSITRADLAIEIKGREAHRITGTIVSAANVATQLTDMRFLFGPVLDDVVKSLPLLRANSVPPSPIAMTNEAALHGGIKLDFEKWVKANGGNVAPEVKDLELTMLWQITPTKSLFDAKFEITLAISSMTRIEPSLPLFGNALIILGNLQLEVRDAGNFYTLQLGGGLGVGATLPGKIQLLAFAALTIFFISGTDTFAVGATLLLKGDADAGPVEIEVSAEAKLFVLHIECQAANVPTTWLVGQLTLAIEITLAFFLDIEVDLQWKMGGKLEEGPCELPDDVS